MSLRRAALIALVALAACDPTGNVNITADAANVRLANFVVDATGLTSTVDGLAIHTNIAFGGVGSYQLISVDDSVIVIRQTSDGFLAATDTVLIVNGRHYTFYALGVLSSLRPRFTTDDTVFATAGNIKVRVIHGVGAQSFQGLDFYLSLTSDSLVDLVPLAPSVAYGAQSAYLPADTAFRRLRLTPTGQTTVLVDTTFAAFADSSVITLVASDKQGGGPPIRLQVVIDKAP
ncbi:MAG: DUF4397 domain-containing protein [Gemmatimonadales bacterium]